jgi:hypothetical protein
MIRQLYEWGLFMLRIALVVRLPALVREPTGVRVMVHQRISLPRPQRNWGIGYGSSMTRSRIAQVLLGTSVPPRSVGCYGFQLELLFHRFCLSSSSSLFTDALSISCGEASPHSRLLAKHKAHPGTTACTQTLFCEEAILRLVPSSSGCARSSRC